MILLDRSLLAGLQDIVVGLVSCGRRRHRRSIDPPSPIYELCRVEEDLVTCV
jgi:hypothetical protein